MTVFALFLFVVFAAGVSFWSVGRTVRWRQAERRRASIEQARGGLVSLRNGLQGLVAMVMADDRPAVTALVEPIMKKVRELLIGFVFFFHGGAGHGGHGRGTTTSSNCSSFSRAIPRLDGLGFVWTCSRVCGLSCLMGWLLELSCVC